MSKHIGTLIDIVINGETRKTKAVITLADCKVRISSYGNMDVVVPEDILRQLFNQSEKPTS